ncbi:MAG: c-type cytochrome, partial [Rhodospirillales bacterium]|nr:c-type cytochrome [Rhodospirillales bacterium]
CMQCHGEQGISVNPMIPNLAGQNKLYLVKQLKEFQAGPLSQGRPSGPAERHSRIMKGQVKNLENNDLWNLASFFSELPACPVNGNKVNGNKPEREIAERKPPKSARQCVECHGPQWRGTATVVPQLGGQKRQYLLRQLYAFRLSPNHPNQNKSPGQAKETRYHFLMSGIAKSLKKAELYELAEYYAEQGCS